MRKSFSVIWKSLKIIYESVFENASGGYGVIGGTHELFTEIEKWHDLSHHEFVSSQLQIFECGFQVNPDVNLLGYKTTYEDIFNHYPDTDNVNHSFTTQSSLDLHTSFTQASHVLDDTNKNLHLYTSI